MKIAQYSRLSRHVAKKLDTTIHGLRPSGIYGRFVGPRVLLNSIPKAGTHLLETALEQFRLLRNAGKRTITCWDTPSAAVLRSVRSIGKGQFLNAHLSAHQELFDIVAARSIKVLFMIRDPRDIVVSHFKYVSGIDATHWAHEHYAGLENDDARLLASIVGVDDLKPSIGEMLRRLEPWMSKDSVLVCRFEDLIGPNGGGSSELQLWALKSIASHLGISMSDDQLSSVADRTFSSKSSTFRKGKVGGWKEYFKAEHVKAFKQVAGRELIAYGYEESKEW